MLAYKTTSPDNREIALVHLAQNIPQRVIHLSRGFRFVCFVSGSNERIDTACQIMFLVKNDSGNLQLMMIKSDPWKNIDQDDYFEEPESVFMFQGVIGIPKEGDERYRPRLFSADKIKDVQLLHDVKKCLKGKKVNYATLVIQFEHCIGTASLNSGKFKIQSHSPAMVRRVMCRGYKEDVIFAETHGDRDKVFKLELNEKNHIETVKNEIFSHPKKIITIQRAAESFVPSSKEKSINSFYIMDSDQKVHRIINKADDGIFTIEDA